ncbi:MAG: phytoene desaturase family protein [Polyangiales bacterium]
MNGPNPGSRLDVVVVGGGLAGLAAAVKLGRAGKSVALVERRHSLGGRASTHREEGFALNEGAHAIYEGRAARRVLSSLGIFPRGGKPSASGGLAVVGDAMHTLPGGPVSLMSTGLFDLGAKLEAGRLLAGLQGRDPSAWRGVPFSRFLDETCTRPMVRALVAMLGRVATYCADHDVLDAEIALEQMQTAMGKGVTYVDGGWVTIVEALEKAAREAGVRFVLSDGATAIEHAKAVTHVRLAGGESLPARAVLLAGGPKVAASLAPVPSLQRAAAESVPVRVACIDLALRTLPFPKRRLAFALDAPLYFSLHSAFARLAPEGSAVVHLMKYLREGERGEAAIAELDALFSRVQPEAEIAIRRVLPSMTVANARVEASRGGLAGRPDVAVPEVAGLYVAGDWVGPEGLLSDASLASAERAADRILGVESPSAAAA